jgi:hypothetical protein
MALDADQCELDEELAAALSAVRAASEIQEAERDQPDRSVGIAELAR